MPFTLKDYKETNKHQILSVEEHRSPMCGVFNIVNPQYDDNDLSLNSFLCSILVSECLQNVWI